MRAVRLLALLLMVIGSLNWGLIALFDYNIVENLFGEMSSVSRLIYGLVGLAGLYGIGMLCRKCCKPSGGCGCGCGPNCNCHKR